MNEKMMTQTFFKIYTVYVKKLGEIVFPYCLLTCLNKVASVLLKLINI